MREWYILLDDGISNLNFGGILNYFQNLFQVLAYYAMNFFLYCVELFLAMHK